MSTALARMATAIHWPECWDTAAYPTAEAALSEVLAWFKCTNQDTCALQGAGEPMAPTDDLNRIRAIADSLDCMLDEDLQALGGLQPGTTEAWRKRGKGPPYLIFGNRTLYPKKTTAAYLQTLIRERTRVPLKDAL